MRNLMDYPIFHFGCWVHDLFLALLILGISRAASFGYFFSGLCSFLTLLRSVVSLKTREGHCALLKKFLPHASLFPLALYSAGYILLTSLPSELPLLNSGDWQGRLGFSLPAYHLLTLSRQQPRVVTVRDSFASPLSGVTLLPCLILEVWKQLCDTLCVLFSVVLGDRVNPIPIVWSWLKEVPNLNWQVSFFLPLKSRNKLSLTMLLSYKNLVEI